MTRIELLNDIDVKYGLHHLVRAGWYRDVYNQYDIFLKQGFSVTRSVKMTSDKFDVDERTIWNIKKRMENE
jgi:hypothetical protein